MVYFGSVEDRAKPLVKYLEAIPGTKPLPPHTNPADWMLTVRDTTAPSLFVKRCTRPHALWR